MGETWCLAAHLLGAKTPKIPILVILMKLGFCSHYKWVSEAEVIFGAPELFWVFWAEPRHLRAIFFAKQAQNVCVHSNWVHEDAVVIGIGDPILLIWCSQPARKYTGDNEDKRV